MQSRCAQALLACMHLPRCMRYSKQQLMRMWPCMQEVSLGVAKAADSPLPTGRLLIHNDITPQLKGRQAEVPSH